MTFLKLKDGEVDKLYLDFINNCIKDIKLLCEYLYSKLSDESKVKPLITIFSLSIGNGIVESLFALYLKKVHTKEINLIYCDPYNLTPLLISYNIYNNIIGLYQLLPAIEIQLLVVESTKLKLISNILLNNPIDIFITNNPYGYKYQNLDMPMPKEFLERKKQANLYIQIMHKYIDKSLLLNGLTEEQKSKIFMIWLIWDYQEVNFENIEESMKQIFEKDKIFKINKEFAFSSITNLKQITHYP